MKWSKEGRVGGRKILMQILHVINKESVCTIFVEITSYEYNYGWFVFLEKYAY